MQLDKRQIRRAFGRAATTYDQVAVLQQRMVDEIIARLELVQLEPRTIIDLGCGTGYGARALAQKYPQAKIIALDLALEMLRVARSKNSACDNVSWLCGDAESLPLRRGSVDLILCSATLQWCDLAAVFAQCAAVLRREGLFTFASFGPDTLAELRAAWRRIDDQVHVHEFVDMHNVGDALVHAGFADPVLDVERVQLTYADPKQALDEVRKLGSTNAAVDRRRGLLGKQRYRRLLEALSAGSDGRVPVTFECVYGHAFATGNLQQEVLPDGSVTIPVPPHGIQR